MGAKDNTVNTNDRDLLRVVANELKIPLTNIKASSSLLVADKFEPEEILEQQKRLQINSEQALEMVDAILLAGRVQTSQASLELTAINPAGAVRRVAADLEALAARYNHTLRVVVSDKLSSVNGNQRALEISISAMLSSLIRSSSSEVIEVLIHNRLDRIMISLRDEGPPINSSTVKSVLKNLGQSVQPAKSLPSSSGLSVYVCTILLDAMGGKLDAYSADNKRAITMSLSKSQQLSLL